MHIETLNGWLIAENIINFKLVAWGGEAILSNIRIKYLGWDLFLATKISKLYQCFSLDKQISIPGSNYYYKIFTQNMLNCYIVSQQKELKRINFVPTISKIHINTLSQSSRHPHTTLLQIILNTTSIIPKLFHYISHHASHK